MADRLLQQGKATQWLCDSDTGGALVKVVGGGGVESDLVTNYDSVSTVLAYVGKAAPGTSGASTGWQVKKLVFNSAGDVTTTYAGGTSGFDKVWNDRAGFTYS